MDKEAVSTSEAISAVESTEEASIPFAQKKAEEELRQLRDNAIDGAIERRDIRGMRLRWSNWILICIVFIVISDLFIIFNVGYGLMRFEGVVLPIFVGESIIKVIVLAVIIVSFLFNKVPHNEKD